jgi:hypothetical protein
MRPRSTSGQSTVEYVAVVALVAIVFAIAGGFTLQGRAIAAATVGQLNRGMCIVLGHDCPPVHPPCTVSSHKRGTDLSADVFVVRLGGGSSAIIERRSDGKVAVTIADHLDVGATGGFGASLKVGDKLAMGGEVRAALVASLGHGTTYEVNNELQAEALIRRLRRPNVDPNFLTPAEKASRRRVDAVLPRIPTPTTRYRELTLTGSGTLGPLSGKLFAGGREDIASGKRTYYLKAGVSLEGTRGIVSGGAGGEGQIAITVDRHGHPVDLMLLGALEAKASVDVPAKMQEVAGDLRLGAGARLQVEGHLDLTQPGRMSAVLASIADPAGIVDMVYDEGTVQATTYAAHDTNLSLEGHVKGGFGIGGSFSHTSESSRLLAAMEHTPEGFWVPRYDCLAAAGA